jgi:hypothetical protein
MYRVGRVDRTSEWRVHSRVGNSLIFGKVPFRKDDEEAPVRSDTVVLIPADGR